MAPKSRTASECPNCGTAFTQAHAREVYCGPPCRSVADVVRYMRSVRERYGERPPEDVQYAIQIQIAWALAGGYPSERRLDAETRDFVKSRDGGNCLLCGETGDEIDHIAGDSNRPSNLRLLCSTCHRKVTLTRLRPLDGTNTDQNARLLEILVRASADEPVRPCDVADWQAKWSSWVREHRTAVGLKRRSST